LWSFIHRVFLEVDFRPTVEVFGFAAEMAREGEEGLAGERAFAGRVPREEGGVDVAGLSDPPVRLL